MPKIYDNIEQRLLPALQQSLALSHRADFCVGYFNLRGWRELASYIDTWDGSEENRCRLLVGMQRLPQDELRSILSLSKTEGIDNQTALRLKRRLAEEFREQLMVGIPTSQDELGLRQLASQIRAGKVIVKLFLRHPLHAKLYLAFRKDPISPIMGYMGSSNLTLPGLSGQGELNIDVLDQDATQKLATWFDARWNDRLCMDISNELAQIIEESWAREDLIDPYYIYLKMAYHLSQEARAGLAGFRIPKDFQNKLFDFQAAAVKIAARHLNKRGGVIIGDVVGLGKTLMATALARIFEDDYGLSTLIICPKNLVKMWEDYRDEYGLRARIVSISRVTRELPDLRRFKLVILDESHNLRNREGQRYRVIEEYIRENDSLCILLSATPYNKTYLDLSNQLRLFIREDEDLGIRPEHAIREISELEFARRHQCSLKSLAAFEKSEHPDDWRELMSHYMVRRTRSFIRDNYAEVDPESGRKFLTFSDGRVSYFPDRLPRTIQFPINEQDPQDQYAHLYGQDVVDAIDNLNLPRYGLGNYIRQQRTETSQDEEKIIANLSRAGQRLMGFCRTNLFKRLESSGHAFVQSVERHIVRNYVHMYAISENLPLPLGTQDVGSLDTNSTDADADAFNFFDELIDDNGEEDSLASVLTSGERNLWEQAVELYHQYQQRYARRFKWIRADLFEDALYTELEEDSAALADVLSLIGKWDPACDAKLQMLADLVTQAHPNEKVIVFSQFADTVNYLVQQLEERNVSALAGVTGASANPTEVAWRFSPVSNNKRDKIASAEELRVLIATDVLSEGQNLQDCAIVVNYDLPWAIIRLIQRAGRVDRIGQQADSIYCYSFLPADGVEQIIRLRQRVRQRLSQNAEVVGTDEAFFEDDLTEQRLLDLYHEKPGILDEADEEEVDFTSYAFQIWKNAITNNPRLEKIIPALPSVIYSTRPHIPFADQPEGVLVYLRTGEGNDALAWIDREGNSVTESPLAILRAAQCSPDEKALERLEAHHELVAQGVEQVLRDERRIGGQLGRPSGARFRTYERLKYYADSVKGTLFDTDGLRKALDEIYQFPLRPSATDTLNRQLRSGITDESLAELVVNMREDDRLCIIDENEQKSQEPRIVCSMGLRNPLETE